MDFSTSTSFFVRLNRFFCLTESFNKSQINKSMNKSSPHPFPTFPYPFLPFPPFRNPPIPPDLHLILTRSQIAFRPRCLTVSTPEIPVEKKPSGSRCLDGRDFFRATPFRGNKYTPNDALNWTRFFGVGVTIFGGYLIYSLNFRGGVIEIVIFCYRNMTTNGL